ncbi:hypothetical protein [Neobacillus sp. D3-1R]|uniref:hypothetical protein n=1 Tax=Neobacillus sp. D3-1R TaxID=3445778 RepID=UPI003F9ECE5B
MGVLLFSLLVIISIACFLEGKNLERRGLRFTLSLLLSILVPLIMTGSLDSLLVNHKLEGVFYILAHTILPTVAFTIFQLFFYHIKLFK